KPIDNKIFFAGEATCREHPATVLGAYLSGVREAGVIDEMFHPTPKRRKNLLKIEEIISEDIIDETEKISSRGWKRSVFATRHSKKNESLQFYKSNSQTDIQKISKKENKTKTKQNLNQIDEEE